MTALPSPINVSATSHSCVDPDVLHILPGVTSLPGGFRDNRTSKGSATEWSSCADLHVLVDLLRLAIAASE